MLLQRVDDWDFDIFRVHELEPSGGTLCLLGHVVFRAHGVDDLFHIPKECLHRFLRNIQSAYKENPYHNAVHAGATPPMTPRLTDLRPPPPQRTCCRPCTT